MTVLSVVLLFLNLAATVTLASQSICQNQIYCPCGSTGKNISVCIETNNSDGKLCRKWSRCKRCEDGLNKCLQCEDGFEGPLCSDQKRQTLKSLQKRKFYPHIDSIFQRRRRAAETVRNSCSNRYSAKLGSMRCVSNDQQMTCVGKCLPGFSFENLASANEITLTCYRGVWSPLSAFPPCKLISSKATCSDPGFISDGFRRSTDGSESNTRRSFEEGNSVVYGCQSDDFALRGSALLTCKSDGTWSNSLPKCISSVARQGVMCPDPGQVANADRMNSDGTPAVGVQQYEVGQSLVFTCHPGYALQRRSLITCLASGRWSSRTPYCNRAQPPSSVVQISPARGPDTMFCYNPGKIFYGRVKIIPPAGPVRLTKDDVEYPEGTQLEYTCDDGFILQGSDSVTCQTTGFWTTDPPKCAADCGVSFAQTTRKIHNGDKTIPGEWPWVVAISVEGNSTTTLICGGVVLNSQTVMTAAHCLTGASRYILYFGKHRRRNKDDDTDVLVGRSTEIIIHPAFSSTTFDSDIGLVKFEPPVQFSFRVQPICLPTPESTVRNIMTGNTGYVTGWGLTERQVPAEELLVAQLPVLTNQACMESYRNQNLILPLTRSMFCAGFPNGRRSACSGDSGSPLVFYDSVEERYTVEGIVSFGAEGQCGLPGRYTVFTKVYDFLPWVLTYI